MKYLLLLIPIPLLLSLGLLVSDIGAYTALEARAAPLEKKLSRTRTTSSKKSTLYATLGKADSNYLTKHLESLTLLEPEMKRLEALSLHWHQDEPLKKRLSVLKENRLQFIEEKRSQIEGLQETHLQLARPIEMDEEDLKRALSLIEGVTIWPYGPKEGRPQLIIKEFDLTRKSIGEKEFVYAVQIGLIKREASHE